MVKIGRSEIAIVNVMLLVIEISHHTSKVAGLDLVGSFQAYMEIIVYTCLLAVVKQSDAVDL